MTPFRNRALQALSMLFLLAAAVAWAGDPSDLVRGEPELVRTGAMPKENYVSFPARRLSEAWVGWIDPEWFRSQGIDVPTDALANADFTRRVLDALAWQVPFADDQPHSFGPETHPFYADYYGGYGTSQNLGSARAGSSGKVNIKGLGQTPHLRSTDRYHSNGAAKSIEGIDEAIWGGILDRELPYGSNRVVAIVFTGTYGKIPAKNPGEPDEIFPRVLIVREDAIRPAHFQRNIRVDPAIEEKRLLAMRKTFAEALPQPKGPRPKGEKERIRRGFLELVDRRADQYAAHFSRRFYHGSTSPSNLEITGRDLDLGDQTAQPGFSKIVRIKDESAFGEIQSQIDIFEDLLDDLPNTLGPDLSSALPSHAEVRSAFEKRFRASRAVEMIGLAGAPSEVASRLRGHPAALELGDLLAEVATRGSEEKVWIGGAPIPDTGRHSMERLLVALADVSNQPADVVEKVLDVELRNTALSKRLAAAWTAVHRLLRSEAAKAGVSAASLRLYLANAARIRNAPRPDLYRGDRRWKELWNVSDEGVIHGNRGEIAKYIEKSVWRNVRTFKDAEPWQLVLSHEMNAVHGISLRRVFDARRGAVRTILRIDTVGGKGSFYGHPLTREELLASRLEAAGVSGGASLRGRHVEFELPTDAPVDASSLRLETGPKGPLVPQPKAIESGAGWKSPFRFQDPACLVLLKKSA